MRTSRIYYEGELNKDTNVYLPSETSHYLMHVLRLKIGAKVILFNGTGKEYETTITDIQKKTVALRIESLINRHSESPLKIHLAQAISRSEKMDWAIQKAVELGVSRITPLITQYCTVKLNDNRMIKRLSHWRKIIISACEQSGRTIIPALSTVHFFNDWISQEKAALKIYCDPHASQSIADLEKKDDLLILIGPEGGLSDDEITVARNNNFIGISLGPRILRTETAALAAITIFQNQWGDLRY